MKSLMFIFAFVFMSLSAPAFASWDQNAGDHLSVLNLIPVASISATANGTGVDLQPYHGQMAIVVDAKNSSGTLPTLDVKLQDSADNSSFADISPAVAITQVTTVASVQKLVVNVQSIRRYVRIVQTLGGTTPVYISSVKGYANLRQLQ